MLEIIEGAPVLFTIALTVSSLFIWLAVRWLYKGIIDHLKARIDVANADISALLKRELTLRSRHEALVKGIQACVIRGNAMTEEEISKILGRSSDHRVPLTQCATDLGNNN